MVATQVTTAITNSKVITSLPSLLFQQKADRVWETPPELRHFQYNNYNVYFV